MRRLVLVGLFAVVVICGCDNPQEITGTTGGSTGDGAAGRTDSGGSYGVGGDGVGGAGGTDETGGTAAAGGETTIVGDWFPCGTSECNSMLPYDGFRFTDDGRCEVLRRGGGTVTYCVASYGTCTHDGASMSFDQIAATPSEIEFIPNGILISNAETDWSAYYLRVPDNSVGVCAGAGEPCDENSECFTRECDQGVCAAE